MTANKISITANTDLRSSPEGIHLVGGGGGSRAILALAGIIYALSKAGLLKFKSIGGISGGAIVTLMLAAGMSAREMVKLAIDIDFASLMTRRTSPFWLFYALSFKERFETTLPRWSVFSTEKVAGWIDQRVASWPESYWTMAIDEAHKQIIFTAGGVYRRYHDGRCEKISDRPARVSDALRCSMAVPGFISPHSWNGQMLWDGGMSCDGLCPVGIPLSIMGARPEDVIGCHVGARQLPGFKNTLKKSWERILRFGSSFTEEEKDPHRWEALGVTIVHPELNKFGSLKFSLSADEKWDAVISSSLSTARTLAGKGLISAAKLQELESLAGDRQAFIADCSETSNSKH